MNNPAEHTKPAPRPFLGMHFCDLAQAEAFVP